MSSCPPLQILNNIDVVKFNRLYTAFLKRFYKETSMDVMAEILDIPYEEDAIVDANLLPREPTFYFSPATFFTEEIWNQLAKPVHIYSDPRRLLILILMENGISAGVNLRMLKNHFMVVVFWYLLHYTCAL